MPLTSAALASTVTVKWDAVNQPKVIGYRVHYGPARGSYQYSVDVGNITSCTISGLKEGTKYYFAATAYTKNIESDYSHEISHVVSNSPVGFDTDGDGISDDEEIDIYGTDPDRADTDGDGLNDGEELGYWGDNWNADFDSDGLINLLDLDSDNNNFTDGQELNGDLNSSTILPSNCYLDPKFHQTLLTNNMAYYTDRSYKLTDLPSEYMGMNMIKTPNDDRNRTYATDYLTFQMPYDGTVYVAIDARAASLPNWMSGFKDTGDRIYTSLSSQPHLEVYSKTYYSGACVNFGANKGTGFSGSTISNFIVFY